MAKKYYLTTTLPYVNANPHIGFALEIVQADCLARAKRLQGFDVFFNTGTDEHGQKIYQKAMENNQDVKEYCDFWAGKFNKLKQKLNLSYDYFSRTTDKNHIKAAQDFWNRCKENGDIYKAKQTIKYCVGCELEKTDSELVDGRCPLHPKQELEIREEENYFFRFSKYEEKLLEFYEKNPDFVVPNFRLEEIKNFVKNGLQDFSVSRLKSKMPWGIPVPNDPEHVMYVWFDALINYISCLGWPEEAEKLGEFWGTKENRNAVQVAGKDNLRQQSAIWQAMLMSANLPNSKQVFIHGFITSGGVKMSKSLGNVINPFEVVEKYGTDALRYYLLKEIHPFNDGDFTEERFIEIYNSDLANGLGNLVQRVSKMCEKNNIECRMQNVECIIEDINKFFDKYEFHLAIEFIWKKISEADKLVNDKKPWELEREEAEKVLLELVGRLRVIANLLLPFLPQTAEKILEVFSGEIKAPEKALFPRI